jgi:hypothetical protein
VTVLTGPVIFSMRLGASAAARIATWHSGRSYGVRDPIIVTSSALEPVPNTWRWQLISRNADCFSWAMRALCDLA